MVKYNQSNQSSNTPKTPKCLNWRTPAPFCISLDSSSGSWTKNPASLWSPYCFNIGENGVPGPIKLTCAVSANFSKLGKLPFTQVDAVIMSCVQLGITFGASCSGRSLGPGFLSNTIAFGSFCSKLGKRPTTTIFSSL